MADISFFKDWAWATIYALVLVGSGAVLQWIACIENAHPPGWLMVVGYVVWCVGVGMCTTAIRGR